MPTNTPDGGPAFPGYVHYIAGKQVITGQPNGGMSLRDYFAGRFLASVKVVGQVPADEIAENCYIMADAMLRARTARPAPAEPLSPADTMRAHLDTFGGER